MFHQHAPPASVRHPIMLLALLAGALSACASSTTWEGMTPGECTDGADNDGDATYDCDDADCGGSPDCAGEADSDADTDADTDTDTDTDTNTDLHADGSHCEGNVLVVSDGTEIDCDALSGYCGETESGEGACMWYEGGGSTDEGTPSFLAHPLDYDATVRNGWYYNYAGNGAGHPHTAIDFEADEGTEVYAACDGVAMKSSQYASGYGYGNFIQVRCDETDEGGNHYHLIYGHVQSAVSTIVVYGQDDRRNSDYGSWTTVSQGELLGYSGSEDTSWAHLHFEVNLGRYSGTPVDPYDLYAETTGSSASAEQEYPPDGSRYTGCGEHYLWSTCPPSFGTAECDVDGSIDAAEVSGGLLSAQGLVEASAGLERWSLVVDDETVTGVDYSAADTSDSFDVAVDLGSYSLDDGSHTLGLWVRDTTGCTGDAAVDSATISCDARDHHQCDGGDVYWYNACGTRGSSKVACASDETCVDTSAATAECSQDCGNGTVDVGEACDGTDLDGATCATAGYDSGSLTCDSSCGFNASACCTDASYYQCDAGDVYYYDSCDVRGSRKEDCATTETCTEPSSTTATCDTNCGNRTVDSGEDCDGADLDGATCATEGYDSGSLTCDSACGFDVSACCTDASYYQCYAGDVYYYDSCGVRGSRKDNCSSTTEGCEDTSSSTAECYAEAIDNTSTPTACGTSVQDIFTATAVSIANASSSPEITVTWAKCDGSAFSTTKSCDVRVGSYASSGTVRETYSITGSATKYSWTTTFDGWPSTSPFTSESCGATKEFYFTCDEGAYAAHWYGTGAVDIEKDCP